MSSEEEYLQLLAAMQELVRSDNLSPVDRLVAIDKVIVAALSGDAVTSVSDAADLAEGLVLGVENP